MTYSWLHKLPGKMKKTMTVPNKNCMFNVKFMLHDVEDKQNEFISAKVARSWQLHLHLIVFFPANPIRIVSELILILSRPSSGLKHNSMRIRCPCSHRDLGSTHYLIMRFQSSQSSCSFSLTAENCRKALSGW